VAAYEQAHDKRTTVLERVAALTGPEPAPGYDELTADEVQKLLTGGDAALATAVRDYERRHKSRASVLEAAARNADES
jgi:N-acetylmuramic acid 6-phosphate (MurNAc-6-P) etherase